MPRGRPRSSQTRDTETRASSAREVPKTIYTGMFYFPLEIIPKGMTYAWVATTYDNAGTPNHQNWNNKYRSGWVPVPRDRHPELFPPVPNVGFGADTDDIIKQGGQVLCEKPTRDVEAAKRQLQSRSLAQMDGVSWAQGPNQNPFAQTLPRFDDSSKTEFGHKAEFKD